MKRRLGSKEMELQAVALFAACRPEELRRIARMGETVAVPAGTVIATEGTRSREFTAVLRGLADITVAGHLVGVLSPGDHCGEPSVIRNAPSQITVRARTPMRLFVVDPRRFASLVVDVPIVALKLLRSMAGRVEPAASPAWRISARPEGGAGPLTRALSR